MYTIRPANREELDMVIDWSAKEGWNPGLYDADAFYKTDPKGFFLGFLNDKPIASISAVSYNDKFGFLGLYIVIPEYRDKGYGIRIWNEGIRHLPTQNIGLDGVVSQQENYKKSGFKLAIEISVMREKDWNKLRIIQRWFCLKMFLLKNSGATMTKYFLPIVLCFFKPG